MTTRKRVKILVDIIANQVGVLLPREMHPPFVQESERLIERYFTHHKTRVSETPLDELLEIESALFHVTGKLRKWLAQQEGAQHVREESGRRGLGK